MKRISLLLFFVLISFGSHASEKNISTEVAQFEKALSSLEKNLVNLESQIANVKKSENATNYRERLEAVENNVSQLKAELTVFRKTPLKTASNIEETELIKAQIIELGSHVDAVDSSYSELKSAVSKAHSKQTGKKDWEDKLPEDTRY